MDDNASGRVCEHEYLLSITITRKGKRRDKKKCEKGKIEGGKKG
jgi:hypothetical protein